MQSVPIGKALQVLPTEVPRMVTPEAGDAILPDAVTRVSRQVFGPV